MIALGITGRSELGKSTVTAVFPAHGVPLADADQISREILLPGSPLLPRLAAAVRRGHFKTGRHPGPPPARLTTAPLLPRPDGQAALDSLTHPAIVGAASVRQSRRHRPPERPLFVLDGAVIVGDCRAQAGIWRPPVRGRWHPLRPAWPASWPGTASQP